MNWLFLPPWSIRFTALGGLVLVLVLAVRALREQHTVTLRRQVVGLLMRALVIGALVVIALNPTWIIPRKQEGKPTMLVLVDTSRSMATTDVQGKSRLEAALELLTDDEVRSALERDFTLDVRCFDRDTRPVDPGQLSGASAIGRASDIGSAVSLAVGELAENAGQAGVLLISDGRATTEGTLESARLALARSVPLWTWCLGGEVPRKDLWIEVPGSEVLAFAGSEVELSATLHQVGYESRTFHVEVLDDGEVIQRLEVTPDAQGTAPVRVKVTAPDAGEKRLVFRVPQDVEEAEKENNERSVFLRSVGQKVRVLVVEGQPHWDTKFLVQSLKRNERVELTAVYRLARDRQFAVISAGGKQKRTATDMFPRTAEGFNHYDVVILGRGCESFFDDDTEKLLTDFVARQGGGLIFSRGKAYGGRFGPLSKLEPVVWDVGTSQGVRMSPQDVLAGDNPIFELTSTADLDVLLDRLPLFDQVMHTVGVKPLAVTLAEGHAERGSDASDAVVMAYHLYGQGRVLTLNAGGLWRWAFREKGESEEEFIYERFWVGLLRWLLSGGDLLPGHDVALRSDRRFYTDEQPMQFLLRTRGLDHEVYRPKLTIRPTKEESASPEGTRIELEPRQRSGGSYVAQAGPFAPGTYQVRLVNNIGKPAELSLAVEVVSASTENRLLSADPVTMRRLAETSEGKVLTDDDVRHMSQVVRQWQARKQLAEDKSPLWDRWWLLVAILLALGTEWFLRRREGLL